MNSISIIRAMTIACIVAIFGAFALASAPTALAATPAYSYEERVFWQEMKDLRLAGLGPKQTIRVGYESCRVMRAERGPQTIVEMGREVGWTPKQIGGFIASVEVLLCPDTARYNEAYFTRSLEVSS
jgi:hypothetical protein